MINRALLYGLCLIGIGAPGVHAQVLAPGPTQTLVVDDTQKTPNTPAAVPEVIMPLGAQGGARGDVITPKTSEDPAAVLQPPNVDPNMRVESPTTPPGEERRMSEKRLDDKKIGPKSP
jgi:hypothetical protein